LIETHFAIKITGKKKYPNQPELTPIFSRMWTIKIKCKLKCTMVFIEVGLTNKIP